MDDGGWLGCVGRFGWSLFVSPALKGWGAVGRRFLCWGFSPSGRALALEALLSPPRAKALQNPPRATTLPSPEGLG
jgi:hypothetical protein